MGLKDAFDDALNNVKDTLSEGMHKSEADAEQTKRDVAGDTMTPGENASSMLNQAKNTVQGDAAAAKRDIRNS